MRTLANIVLPLRIRQRRLLGFVASLLLIGTVGCQNAAKSAAPATSVAAPSTKPAETAQETEAKRDSDDFALIHQMMAQGDEEPAKIRERWNARFRDRREKSDRALRRQREEFNKRERTARETFLKKLKSDREKFMKASGKSGKTKDFFDEQEARRQDFFNDERDTRKDFESQATEERKSFESFVSERTNQFNQELRDYTASFHDRRMKKNADKQAAEKAHGGKASSGGNPELDEFKKIRETPSTPLAPPDEK